MDHVAQTESLIWWPVDCGRPDADTNVLLKLAEGGSCEGFLDFDGETPIWRDVGATRLPEGAVTHWADMPGDANGVTVAPPRCTDCDLPNGCPEFCRCYPTPAAGVAVHAQADNWRPIKSAPRDGSNILLRFGMDGVSQAKYVPGLAHPWKFIDTNDGITWLVNHAVDGPGGPSHWQPMPPVTRGEQVDHQQTTSQKTP